ncbi:MAG: exo-alpha-sialidase, partial [Bacteroidia bacterium]|nr:exo-alpha-sialidase [Bacteroidia bacterium]
MKNKSNLLLTLLSIIILAPAQAQLTQEHATDKLKMHLEKKSDPYLPNAYDNQKTSPAYYFNSSETSRTTASTIVTTQANLSSGGQNIIGDAANEPSIAISPIDGNKMCIGWRQFDNVSSNFRQAVYAYTTNAGAAWTFPGVIEPGIFRSDPVLEYDDLGNFYYNSLTNSPDFFCTVFKSTDGGVTWGAGTPAFGGDKQWMTIDRTGGVGNGNIYSAWTYA